MASTCWTKAWSSNIYQGNQKYLSIGKTRTRTPCMSIPKFIIYVFRSARTRMPPASRGGTPVTHYDNHYSTSPQPNTDPERYWEISGPVVLLLVLSNSRILWFKKWETEQKQAKEAAKPIELYVQQNMNQKHLKVVKTSFALMPWFIQTCTS